MKKLSPNDIKQNIKALQAMMKSKDISYFYISSFDPFLNEYVPLNNCRRYYVTGFSGSVAEVLVPQTGKVSLYVDGRYHEQADNQVDLSLVNVVKVKSASNSLALYNDLKSLKAKDVGIEADRTSLSFYKKLEKDFKIKAMLNGELDEIVPMGVMQTLGEIKKLSLDLVGESTESKLNRIITNPKKAFFVTALDSLAWLSNARGYHLPFMSSFLGKGLAVKNKLYIFVSEDISVSSELKTDKFVEFVKTSKADFSSILKKVLDENQIKSASFDPAMLSTSEYLILENLLGQDNLEEVSEGLTSFHAFKNETEIKQMESSFSKASKAIFDTINWVKNQESGKISEMDLFNKTSEMYKKHGAITQSFNTISGAGANGSIIHYSEPKTNVMIKDNDMCLLDSGGYFESGYATDCTRTFLAGKTSDINPKYKEMYTLVLKGFLRAQSAVFLEGTLGIVIDGLARNPIMAKGYNYAHGTGHGVGINVHEGGTGVSTRVNNKLNIGNIVSIEPGLYFPGVGGVRIENVCLVEKHPDFEGFCRFRPLIYLGLEKDLIDYELLTHEENNYLNEYQQECRKRGTEFA